MKKLKTKEQTKNYRRYHIPGCGNLQSVKMNAIFLRKGNSIEHERGKMELAWDSEVFITEAERSASDEEADMFNLRKKKKIVDFVDLIAMKEVEIISKHESDKQIDFYRRNGVIPMIVGDTLLCKMCNKTYPRRNKTDTCSLCRDKVNTSGTP